MTCTWAPVSVSKSLDRIFTASVVGPVWEDRTSLTPSHFLSHGSAAGAWAKAEPNEESNITATNTIDNHLRLFIVLIPPLSV